MSSFIVHTQRPDSVPDSAYDPARLVVSEEGRVVYASPAFGTLIHTTPAAIKGARLFELMVFPAFHGAAARGDSRTFGLHTGPVSDIPNGRHSVVVPDFGPPLITFSCEWMQVGVGPRFLVVTRVEDDEQVDRQTGPLMAALSKKFDSMPNAPVPQVVDFSNYMATRESMSSRPNFVPAHDVETKLELEVDFDHEPLDISQPESKVELKSQIDLELASDVEDWGAPEGMIKDLGDVFTPTVDEALTYLNTAVSDAQDLSGVRHTDAFKKMVLPSPVPHVQLVPQSRQSARAAFRRVIQRGTRGEAQIFVDLSDDVMMRVDLNGCIQSMNQAGAMFFGGQSVLSTAPSFKVSLFDVIIPEDQNSVRAVFAGMVHDSALSGRIAVEARMVDQLGTVRLFDMRLRQQGDRVFILAHDLTDARLREQKLARHAAQLAEAESIAHLGYWRWAVGAETLTFSDEMYRIFGINPVDGMPTTQHIASMIPMRDRGRVMQGIERAMFQTGAYHMDFQIKRPTGDVRYIRCEGRCETDDTGDIIALYGMMQDVTDRKMAEHDLMQAKNAAERAYDSKSKFLANMSHELRTPLNAIIGFSEMMQRQLLGPLGNDRYLDYIDGIRASGEHLLDLISDILDMSKIEAGKYTIDPEDVNMGKLVRLAINMVEGRARDAQVVLKTDLPDNDIHVFADRRGVLQMILNVLSNAVKFTKPGGRVTVCVTEDEACVTCSVTDTGIGIPAHLIPMITKPFEQVANHYTRAHDGSGLGLAITKELSQLHGGDVSITSELGVGTTVSFTISKEMI